MPASLNLKKMKIEVGEEISLDEFDKLPDDEGISVINHYEGTDSYFKKAQKFPIVFEVSLRDKIRVDGNGSISFYHNDKLVFFIAPSELPLLVKAVEKAKEVMKKNETDKRISC